MQTSYSSKMSVWPFKESRQFWNRNPAVGDQLAAKSPGGKRARSLTWKKEKFVGKEQTDGVSIHSTQIKFQQLNLSCLNLSWDCCMQPCWEKVLAAGKSGEGVLMGLQED